MCVWGGGGGGGRKNASFILEHHLSYLDPQKQETKQKTKQTTTTKTEEPLGQKRGTIPVLLSFWGVEEDHVSLVIRPITILLLDSGGRSRQPCYKANHNPPPQ